MNKTHFTTTLAALAVLAATSVFAETIDLPVFGAVKVLDAVDCTKTGHGFHEYPAGASRVETILDKPCRVMPVQAKDSSFFSYRLGKGNGLRANGSYVVVLEFPDDLPRNYVLFNRATDSKRSFSTGSSLGDAWAPKYVDNHSESLDLPQSGEYQMWTAYGSLMDRTRDYCESTVVRKDAQGNPVKNDKGEEQKDPVFLSPSDGFDFVVAQYSRDHDPNSQGIAVRRILLCEIPNEKAVWAKVTFPPAPLPRRHIFWREEMSDGGPIQGDNPQCANRIDWFHHKARQMKMLGINTYTKDLLEFGHVQHWDPNFIATNWAWDDGKTKHVWGEVVELMADYGFDLLPYYEWCGNRGADVGGQPSYGNRKLAKTLGGKDSYTHIWWTEGANLDITDPEALAETKRLLDGTVFRYQGKASFAGVVFRTRPTQWPVSFSDSARALFAKEENQGQTPSRDDLKRDRALYDRYIAWWHVKRVAFLRGIQAYFVEKGMPEAFVILDSETSESGPGFTGGGFVVDDRDAWAKAFADCGIKTPKMVSTADTVASHAFLKGRHEPAGTWGDWEWQHACPGDDPENYNAVRNVWLAMPFNRLYSVADPAAFQAYRNAFGTETIVRHYSLNENMLYRKNGDKDESICGYAIADSERAGRACMQNEVVAMANGDPVNLGYFMGSTFSRGFPGPVREFNLNFLALPALPSKVIENACDDPEVVLREIDAGARGRYFALVHTGAKPKKDLVVRFPKGMSGLQAIVTGKTARVAEDGAVTIGSLKPWQLVSFLAK